MLTLRQSLSPTDDPKISKPHAKDAASAEDVWARRQRDALRVPGHQMGDLGPAARRPEDADRPLPDGRLRTSSAGSARRSRSTSSATFPSSHERSAPRAVHAHLSDRDGRLRPDGEPLGAARGRGRSRFFPGVARCCVVANHDSQTDPLAIGVAARHRRQIRALAKRSLWDKPGLGRVLDGMGQIPIERAAGDADALVNAVAALRRGSCIGVFPEGTISVGRRLRARSGIGRLALEVPEARLVCATVEGTPDLARFPKRPRVSASASSSRPRVRPTPQRRRPGSRSGFWTSFAHSLHPSTRAATPRRRWKSTSASSPSARRVPLGAVPKRPTGSESEPRAAPLRCCPHAPVAQLDRASVYETEGHRFESCRARYPPASLPANAARAGKAARSRPARRPVEQEERRFVEEHPRSRELFERGRGSRCSPACRCRG